MGSTYFRFEVNLKCDDDDAGDIALHFNPRFEQRVVVRNSRVGGVWQTEEREQTDNLFPFEKKDAFEMAINVKEDKFAVHYLVNALFTSGFVRLYYLAESIFSLRVSWWLFSLKARFEKVGL